MALSMIGFTSGSSASERMIVSISLRRSIASLGPASLALTRASRTVDIAVMTAVLKLALIGSLAISVAADKDVVILSDADSSVRSMLASRASLAGVELGMDGAWMVAWDGARGFTPAADSSLPILAIDCRAEDSAIFAILVS